MKKNGAPRQASLHRATKETDIRVDWSLDGTGQGTVDTSIQALGEKAEIKRFGFASVPLDETLAQVTVDLSGRPYLVYNVNLPDRKIKTFDLGLFEDFFQAFVTHGGLNLHVNLQYGRNPHHIMEAIFKALARALDQATTLEERLSGTVLSTKGSL